MSVEVKAKFAKPSTFLGSSWNASWANVIVNCVLCFLIDLLWIPLLFAVAQIVLALMFYKNPFFLEEITLCKSNGKAKIKGGEFYV